MMQGIYCTGVCLLSCIRQPASTTGPFLVICPQSSRFPSLGELCCGYVPVLSLVTHGYSFPCDPGYMGGANTVQTADWSDTLIHVCVWNFFSVGMKICSSVLV